MRCQSTAGVLRGHRPCAHGMQTLTGILTVSDTGVIQGWLDQYAVPQRWVSQLVRLKVIQQW